MYEQPLLRFTEYVDLNEIDRQPKDGRKVRRERKVLPIGSTKLIEVKFSEPTTVMLCAAGFGNARIDKPPPDPIGATITRPSTLREPSRFHAVSEYVAASCGAEGSIMVYSLLVFL